MADWHYSNGGRQFGPVSESELRGFVASGALRPDDLVWRSGMSGWQAARDFPELFPSDAPLGPPPVPTLHRDVSSTKLAAGLCAIVVGGLGVHKFILKMNTPGIIMLAVTLFTCVGAVVMPIIGIIEGIVYLTKSDEEFYETYMVGKKEWF